MTYGWHMVHTCLMVDVWNVHISWLMYRTCLHHIRQSEHQNQQSTDNNYLSAIEINFPTTSPTT